MTDATERLEIVREAGQIGLDLLACDTPPVSRYTPEDDDGVPLFEEDDRYWAAWTRIKELLNDFAEDEVEIERWPENQVPFLSANADRYIDGTRFATVGVNYGADGVNVINIEFKIDEGWATYINDYQDDLTALDIGRQIGAVELAVLAYELQSPTETLDYWMTENLYRKQSSWAKVRQASRQTVNDRVRSARSKLGFEDDE